MAAPLHGRGAPVRVQRRGNRLFASATVAGRPFEALLDTGAGMSVLDRGAAARLGIRATTPATVLGTGGNVAAGLSPPVPLTVAGVALGARRLVITDLAEISGRLFDRPLALIAGRELFDAGRFALDTRAPSLTRAGLASPPGIALPLTARRGIETVPAVLEDRPVQAEIDIGNGDEVLVHARIARRLDWFADGRPAGTVGGAGGLGGPRNRRLTVARTLTVAGRTFLDVPVGVDDQPNGPDMNLSTAFLDAFRLTLDFPGRRAWFAAR